MIKLDDDWGVDRAWNYRAVYHLKCKTSAQDSQGYVLSVDALLNKSFNLLKDSMQCLTCESKLPETLIEKLKFIYHDKIKR